MQRWLFIDEAHTALDIFSFAVFFSFTLNEWIDGSILSDYLKDQYDDGYANFPIPGRENMHLETNIHIYIDLDNLVFLFWKVGSWPQSHYYINYSFWKFNKSFVPDNFTELSYSWHQIWWLFIRYYQAQLKLQLKFQS